ncbi:GGDEF domain-containing protein [Stenotrophomonas pictorum]|nr:GGDEF domain-containing protein [Stenotrophomonas pictorum]
MEPASGPSPSSPNLPHELRRVPLRTIAPTTSLLLLFFSVWLALNRQWGWALCSAAVATPAVIACTLIYRRAPKMGAAGLLLCIAHITGCLLAAGLLGRSALPWSYLALMANFFLVRQSIATPANLLLVAGLIAMPPLLRGPPPDLQALVVIILIFGFGYRFSRRLQGDHTRLELLASLDALTGLPNRRALEKALQQQINGARENRFRQALVVLDIDHFKEVNDRHGHAAGDAALSDLAAILHAELRDNDKVFRFGGEEFVILAETGSREALAGFSERIRNAVFQALNGPDGRITISLGAAMYGGEQHWQDWFSRADAALYRAKSEGRNSFAIADDLP